VWATAGRSLVTDRDSKTVRFALTYADRSALDVGYRYRPAECHRDGRSDCRAEPGILARRRVPSHDRR